MSEKEPEAHLFICTHNRENGESCGAKGGAVLRGELKLHGKSAASGWGDRVKVTASGCLGHCENGIACVLYPTGGWRLNQKAEDKEKFIAWVNENLK